MVQWELQRSCEGSCTVRDKGSRSWTVMSGLSVMDRGTPLPYEQVRREMASFLRRFTHEDGQALKRIEVSDIQG